jgi:hypothetical protein
VRVKLVVRVGEGVNAVKLVEDCRLVLMFSSVKFCTGLATYWLMRPKL